MMRYFGLLLIMTFAMKSQGQTQKVIFVCEHGAAKSVVAATYFNQIARERNLNWEAVSRGTNPDAAIGQSTKDGLTKDHLYDPNFSPRKLMLSDTTRAERIIVFTKLPDQFQSSPIPTEDWSQLPNINAGYEQRRDALIKKINQFFDSVAVKK